MTKNDKKRRELFPDTKCFTYDNRNPKLRITGDCVIRALACALDKPWEWVMNDLNNLGVENGYVAIDDENVALYLAKHGFIKRKELRKSNNTRYYVKEFCSKFAAPNKVYYMNAGTAHVVCIKDMKVHDIWYSQNSIAHSYWEKEI